VLSTRLALNTCINLLHPPRNPMQEASLHLLLQWRH
jgi:hypothetical protein